ncbi:MAG: RagB/SusD family nutrient uptake outer membrane protein [Ferruginibacter sp.]
MKKYNLYAFLIAAITLTAGCKKYLDHDPDNRTQITTPDQISQLLTSAYPKGNYILFCESMSDNAEDKNGSGTGYDFIDRVNRQAFRYEAIEAAPDDLDSPDFYWNSVYKAVAACNLALEIIDKSPNKDQLTAQRGEALLARAYSHFMLVTLFAKAYDPTTAATDPGIPYVTTPEKVVFAKYERKTVAYVYDMIEKDLKEGYPLINEKIYGTAPKFHFNKQAAAAFATRFYMFKRDYASVVNYAAQALSGVTADNLRPWNTVLFSLQYYEAQAEYTKATLRGNLLLQEANSVWGRAYPSLRYGLGNNVFTRLFNSVNPTGWIYAYTVYGTPAVYNIPKFYEHFVKESISASSGDPYNTIPLFTAEEVVLNRAEAYMRLNNRTAAIDDLNAFVSKNIDSYAPTDNVTPKKMVDFFQMPNDTSGAIINTALEFKRAFFIHEGMRWFDILRLKIPVTHVTTSGEIISLTPDDKRRALQLPVLTKQAGLEPNIR